MAASMDAVQPTPNARPVQLGHTSGSERAGSSTVTGACAPLAVRRAEPGSAGEHALQAQRGTTVRAREFYDQQVVVRLTEQMQDFLARTQMLLVATADSAGDCDSSARFGPPGFLVVLDDTHLAYPDYRGNGVMASLGNISENPHVGLLALDLVTELIGLHVNGHAHIVEDEELRAAHVELPDVQAAQCWVVVGVVEAYVQCRKYLPRMVAADLQCEQDSDDPPPLGGRDQFGAMSQERPWLSSGGTRHTPGLR